MPTRYLKPGIRDSETIDKLSPMAECLYYRLIVTVDDFGRYDARPSMVRSACYPVKESVTTSKCEALLKELADSGLIVVYAVDGKPYMQVQKWDNIPRAKESKYPAHENVCTQVYASVCDVHTDVPLTVTVTVTETQTGTETETPRKRVTPSKPDDVDQQTWDDWIALRKAKRAPVTQTVIDGAVREAGKAGLTLEAFLQVWCRRGSQGLEAAWLKPEERNQPMSFAQQDAAEKRKRWEEMTGRKWPDEERDTRTIDFIDAESSFLRIDQ